jgi:glycosyltransferase involved in cell wall biosynthesis
MLKNMQNETPIISIGINARFLANENKHTGIGIHTKNLIQSLAKLDSKNEYHIVCHKPKNESTLGNFKLPKNFHYHVLSQLIRGNKSIAKSFWEAYQLPRLMKKLKVDIVHSTYPNLSKFKKQKHIVTVHDVIPWIMDDYSPNFASKLYHGSSKKTAQSSDHIFSVSEFSKKEIQKHLNIPSNKITITPNAIDSDFENHKSSPPVMNKPYVVYVGGYDKRKNVEKLVEIYKKHIAPFHGVDLVLIGSKLHDSPLYNIPTSSNSSMDHGKIIHTGFISEQEKKNFITHAIALMHLSLYEGFNIPLLEAMHVGTPILASDIEPHREVAGNAAIYLNMNDEESLAKALKTFFTSPDIQRDMKAKGFKQAKKYDWNTSVKIMHDMYLKIRSQQNL